MRRLALLIVACTLGAWASGAFADGTETDPDLAKRDAYYATAQKAIEAKDWNGAVAKLKLAERRNPDSADLHNLLGYSYRHLKQYDLAFKHYKRSTVLRRIAPRMQINQVPDLTRYREFLASNPGEWRPFAGGTDLMVLLEAGKLPAGRYLSLRGLAELRGISITEDEIVLGALTTYTDVMRSEALQAECPLVCQAAAETGGVATQNRGTIGALASDGSRPGRGRRHAAHA